MAGRVAHIVPTDRIAYYMLRGRLQCLERAGYDITIICGRSRTGLPDVRALGAEKELSYADELRSLGFDVVHIPFAREIAPFTDLRCAASLAHKIRIGNYDIIHSHNPKGGLLAPPVAQGAGSAAVVHTVHGFLFNDNSRGAHHLLALAAERWTAAWCDHLLFQSEEDFEFARSHHFKADERLHLVGNGIDDTRFDVDLHAGAGECVRHALGWDSRHLVVGAVGRLVAEKGFVEFFETAGILARELPQLRVLVVGISEEDQSDALDPRRLIDANGLTDRCVLLERRSDMPQIYLAMDLLVHHSYREGLSRTLMEASGMGRAIVASDIRGSREIVEDGVTGLLAPSKDVEAFVLSARELLEDPRRRAEMGRRGRRLILERYTEEKTAARIVDCYEHILDDSSS